MISPLLMFSVATRVVVPWRVESFVQHSICPGRIGNAGCVRSRAEMCDFSST